MNLELSLLLGLNCNFSCSHCLNDSKPGKRVLDFTSDDYSRVIAEISRHKEITNISFVGGEPLLYLSVIQKLVNEVREQFSNRQIRFSITTNGSLISKNAEALQALKIESVIFSYDTYHQSYLDLVEFEKAIVDTKKLFEHVTIAFTFEKTPDFHLIQEVALKHNVQVEFVRAIESGRFKKIATKSVEVRSPLLCPNIKQINSEVNFVKLTYIPKHGFTTCCGPLLFDYLNQSSNIIFPTIEAVLDSQFYKQQKTLMNVSVKKSCESNCENCVEIFKNQNIQKYAASITGENNWSNMIKGDLTEVEAKDLSKLFHVRSIFASDENSFTLNPRTDACKNSQLIVEVGDTLSSKEIEAFSDFTIETFYKVFSAEHTEADIKKFKADQSLGFNMPFRFCRHFLNGELIAFQILLLIEHHPYFEKPIWHMGYNGISQTIKDTEIRIAIKNDWVDQLHKLNLSHPISGVVDSFNWRGHKLLKSFGMVQLGNRLNLRKV